MINRRSFLQGSGAVAGLSTMGLLGCTRHVVAPIAPTAAGAPALPFYDAVGPIIPIRADMDRIFRITVCTRPFRPAGPRQDVERVGDKVVVHNYGHGGSGWSLSWGSADVVVRKVLADGSAQREVAVIGAGALDLRAECIADLSALSALRVQVSAVAERWAADRPGLRLWFASALAREEARRIGAGRRGELGLTERTEIPKLAAWFGRANRARGLLLTPLRADLVLVDLLRDWPARTAGRA